ncbi:MAG: amidohydrolase family protein [Polyangiales bacterium]
MFDAHFHIIDHRFPLVPNQGYTPPAFDVSAYRRATQDLGISGGALVSGSFQAFDQSYLVDALEKLGDGFVGVTQLPETVADDELVRLDRAGVRAVRFNLRRGGSAGVAHLEAIARRVDEVVGWHVELYVDARTLPELEPCLRRLPRVGIDHLGLTADGLPALRRHIERGGFVKATGFGRLDFDPRGGLRDLVAAGPESVVFGTDLPSTRAPRPFSLADVELVRETLDPSDAERVFRTNAERIYLART